jgi:purine-nucleoside phosphorylase
VLGSGLGDLAGDLDVGAVVSYSEIPGFLSPTVSGHAGHLLVGHLYGLPIALLAGRSHYYEHGDTRRAAFGVRLLHALGCQILILTAAAGGLNPDYRVGDLMLVTDHISLPALMGHGPLVGDNAEGRFVDMVDSYAPGLQDVARSTANGLIIGLREGVYAQTGGPQYETPAEQRLLRMLGADAVGMSAATETITARRLGMQVLAIVCITNVAGGAVSHSEVLAVGQSAGARMRALLQGIVSGLA